MKILYVYHCLGLGDTIICNGIINNCTAKFDKVVIFCKPQFYSSVCFLYRNNDKVFIIKADDAQAGAIFDNILYDTKIKVGFASEATVISEPSTVTVIWLDDMWRGYQTRFDTRSMREALRLREVITDQNKRNQGTDRSNQVLHPEWNPHLFSG